MNKQKCLVDDCSNCIVARGLCRDHYAYASYQIFKGNLKSWEDLEKKGVALPARKKGNGLFDKFYKSKN